MSAVAAQQVLLAVDLDELLGTVQEVDPLEAELLFRAVIADWNDPQAVSNLLWHPRLLPADLQLPALQQALTGSDGYLQLAAAVGSRTVTDGADPESPESRSMFDALLGVVAGGTGLPARQAAISLRELVPIDRAHDVITMMGHPDAEVRRSLVAALVELFGGEALDLQLADADWIDPARAAAFRAVLVADGIDLTAEPGAWAPKLEYLPNLAEQ